MTAPMTQTTPTLDVETAAQCLAELGHPIRLSAFKLLVDAGGQGLSVGELQRRTGTAKSTLAHHLSRLVWAGLVTQTREGRVTRCRVDADRTRALLGYLVEECCDGMAGLEALRLG